MVKQSTELLNKNTVAVFVEAKRLLIDVGWTQGKFAKYNWNTNPPTPESYCLHGALMVAKDNLGIQLPYSEIVKSALNPWYRKWISRSEVETISWNDALGREKEEVIALIDKIIEKGLKGKISV